jgi:hypothetical protein
MAVYLIQNAESYVGASTDTKPSSVPVGSIFYEYDTHKRFRTYDGTNWIVEELYPIT